MPGSRSTALRLAVLSGCAGGGSGVTPAPSASVTPAPAPCRGIAIDAHSAALATVSKNVMSSYYPGGVPTTGAWTFDRFMQAIPIMIGVDLAAPFTNASSRTQTWDATVLANATYDVVEIHPTGPNTSGLQRRRQRARTRGRRVRERYRASAERAGRFRLATPCSRRALPVCLRCMRTTASLQRSRSRTTLAPSPVRQKRTAKPSTIERLPTYGRARTHQRSHPSAVPFELRCAHGA